MIALASRRLGRVEKGQPLLLGTNKTEGGYNFAVEASEAVSYTHLEKRFSSIEALKEQLLKDAEKGKAYFTKNFSKKQFTGQ